MITGTEMYWLTRLTGLRTGTEGVGIVLLVTSGIAITIGLMAGAMEDSERGRKPIKFSVLAFIVGGLIAFASIFIPTTKEMCAIKVIPVIANNKQIQELPDKVLKLANEWIDELKPNKDSE